MELKHGSIKADGKEITVMTDEFAGDHEYRDEDGGVYDCLSITKALEVAEIVGKVDWSKYEAQTMRGSELHKQAENSITSGKLQSDEPDVKFILDFVEAKKKEGYEAFTEFAVNGNVYDRNFVGTIDCVLVKDNKAVVCDWKTGKSAYSYKRAPFVQTQCYAKLLKMANPKLEIVGTNILYTAKQIKDRNDFNPDCADSLFQAIARGKSYAEVQNEKSASHLSNETKRYISTLKEVIQRENEIKADPKLKEAFDELADIEAKKAELKESIASDVKSKDEIYDTFRYGGMEIQNSMTKSYDTASLVRDNPDLMEGYEKFTKRIVIKEEAAEKEM